MKFEPIFFFIAIFIGFLYVYITAKLPRVIVKNPNKDIEDTLYVDDNDVCYRYKKECVSCK